MFHDDGSSSVTSSPLQNLPMMPLSSPALQSPWIKELKSEERGLCLIHLLLTCATHVANGSTESASMALDQISHLASPQGDTMQRIASYFTESLAERVLKAWPGLHRALHSTRIPMVSEEVLVRKMFFEFFPFLKVAYVVANQAVVEAMEGEKIVHIIDLNAADASPLRALLQDLSARPEGPPHLKITGVHPQKEVLDQIAHVLGEDAEKLDIPFQFNPVVSDMENLDVERLRVKTGEAVGILSVLKLHSLLASDDGVRRKSPMAMVVPKKHANSHQMQRALALGELLEKDLIQVNYSPTSDSVSSSPMSSSPPTKMEAFLNALWGLSPKVMVVAEQDSNHNGATLMERLSESLYFYAALFDCLESTLPRSSMERLKMEKMLFGEEIKNIVACEGGERKERHERLDRWIRRMDSAGFGKVSLSYYAMLQARRLMQSAGCEGYKIREQNGCVVICWQDRTLFSVSAWRCRRPMIV